MTRRVAFPVLLVLAACTSDLAEPRGGEGRSHTRSDTVPLDDLPSYDCPPPPDDALIYYMSAANGLHSFANPAIGFYQGYFHFASLVLENQDTSSIFGYFGEPVLFEEAAPHFVLYRSQADPLDWQGEMAVSADDSGGGQAYYLDFGVVYDGVYMWTASGNYGPSLSDTEMCFSHFRPDRLVGTGWLSGSRWVTWTDAEPSTVADPGPVWFAYNDVDRPFHVGGRDQDYLDGSAPLRMATNLSDEYIDITEEQVWPHLAEEGE